MNTKIANANGPILLIALAVVTTLPIFWANVIPMIIGSAWVQHNAHVPVLLIHVWGGLAMLVFGALNLYVGITRRWFRYHRYFGFAYLGLGSVGAVAALVVSAIAPHKPSSLYIATGTLSIFWLLFAAMAWRAARNGRYDTHREWVIRSYVLTWTFVGCRLAGIIDFYPWLGVEGITAAIWVNWIVPALLCEIALQWRRGSRINSAAIASPRHS